ncbi:DUF4158 domain-containing protein [Acrocarpospora catenulata]|uniref:DUF4158 domain-containing protein n=1 Tax=Acrocarpospora catenulata TaxID=2836182 RepID=UPI002023B6CA|nr:DUF4158 domain-containing protein [Acrocarpospora catenulata]
MARAPMDIDELVEHWTILDEERDLIAGKRGATRLTFVILLKFYTRYGRFPRGRGELSDEAVEHVAKQVNVAASELASYEWSGSTIEYHRSQIRAHLGFRTCTAADADKLGMWLAENVAHAERRPDRVREELMKHLRRERLEPPTPGRISRIVASALRQTESTWSVRIISRLPVETTRRICALAGITEVDQRIQARAAGAAPQPSAGGGHSVVAGEDEEEAGLLAFIKAAPGNVSLESMMTEIRKLEAVRAVGLPAGLFADVAPKVLAGCGRGRRWRRPRICAPTHPNSRSCCWRRCCTSGSGRSPTRWWSC